MKIFLLRPLLFLLLTPLAFALHAQDNDTSSTALSASRSQEIKAQKSAFITQRLHLTSEEARMFWPIYDRCDAELESLRRQMRTDRKGLKQDSTLSEADAAKAIDQGLADRQQQLDIRKHYTLEFKKSIGSVKTLELDRAERDFNRELLKRMRPQGERGGK